MKFNLLAAIDIAIKAHAGQVRKYTKEPYLSHPFAVAGLVASVTRDRDMITAAILHDVVEDTAVTLETIEDLFGDNVSGMVEGMTNISTPDDGSREARKAMDREHTANSSPEAKTIKLADLIDNIKSIAHLDPEFAKIYMAEKRLLLLVLSEGDSTLFNIANGFVENYYTEVVG